MRYLLIIFTYLVLFNACKEKSSNTSYDKIEADPPSEFVKKEEETKSAASKEDAIDVNKKPIDVKESTTVKAEKESTSANELKSDFKEIAASIAIDIKYATKDNFTKKQIYPCGRCYLRPDAALAIEKAHQLLQSKYNYGLKMFDCYRPRPAQQRLWDVVPNPDYVTPPAKGSMHNRGLAVDLTIVDSKGKDLDMGTPYDFFGKEAHTDNPSLPSQVLTNRQLLTSIMKDVGFSGIRTEWWHFSFNSSAALSDWEWPCK